ncbi:hypothetical protein CTAYLR_000810 [Chrysophaeum taylorii]|uniref:N-acetyltransferase domain-containing protein n=1 Tax=Chrysophaeum taylorii TaxID=2483200 RepID=A0AAD7UQY3_9STRA|nr:hypothetical protein CTAYLR_000810 [Chrysophaeum taylorii]
MGGSSRWVVVALALKRHWALQSLEVRPLRMEQREIVSFAEFRAAAFASGEVCDVSRRQEIFSLVERRMEEGSCMLVAMCAEHEFAGTELPLDERQPSPLFRLFQPPGLDRAELLDQLLDGQQIVGVAETSTHELMLPTHSLEPDEGLYVTALAVHPNHRRSGVATRLLEEAHVRAQRLGARSLMLHVERENAAAIRFYQASDFKAQTPIPRFRQFATALKINPDSHILFTRPV